jgi:uroporphyrinogen decarboxylase
MGRRMVVPLAGYPGITLTDSTIRQNSFNAELQARSLYKLVERTQPDMIFTMMDLSIEAGSLGLPVRYPLAEVATVEWHPVKNMVDLEQYKVIDPLYDGRIWVFLETVRLLRAKLNIPIGTYVAGPFTLAGLMMGANNIALATLDNPDIVHATLSFCERVTIDFAKALEQAGAYVICVLDPTAVMLSPKAYWDFAGASLRNVIRQLDTRTILHICGNTTHLIEPMCETGVQGLSLDTAVNISEVAKRVPEDLVLMGNVDPVGTMLRGDVRFVREDTLQLMERMANYKNFIVSTGCDVPAETPIENIAELVRTVRGAG